MHLMLYDDTLDFPSEESRKDIVRRAGNSKRPSAWAPEHEDEEVGANTKQMRLCPVTACNDMELRSDSDLEVKLSHIFGNIWLTLIWCC